MNKFGLTCPDCDDVIISATADSCPPAVYFGGIKKLYFASANFAGLTSPTNLSEWEALKTAGEIVEVDVMGDKPEEESTEILIQGDLYVRTTPIFTITWSTANLSALLYTSIQQSKCSTPLKFWYETRDHRYGGITGISATSFISAPLERDEASVQMANGTLKWIANTDAPRYLLTDILDS